MATTTACSGAVRLLRGDRPAALSARARGAALVSCSDSAVSGGQHQMTHRQPSATQAVLSRRVALSLLSVAGSQASTTPWAPASASEAVVDPIPAFSLEDFDEATGWTELPSGLIYKVVRPGEGDKTKGIFDKVDHFQPFPFVSVRYTSYDPSGKVLASSIANRRDYGYQAGVRQEMQDEDGAVMSMVVGERRQFVVPLELAFKRKLFGQPVPQKDCILVDVELLGLQPY